MDSLISGHFPVGYPFESAFYIPVHITFAIWNLPAWIIYRLGLGAPDTVVNLLWARLFLVVCLVGIIIAIKKLLEEVECGEDFEFWAFMIVSSLMIFPPLFDMGQYDCIGICIGLWGTYLAIKDTEKISWKALLLLSLACSYKVFYLFAALCVLFVLEKKRKRLSYEIPAVLGVTILFFILSKVFASLETAAITAQAVTTVTVADVAPVAEISVGLVERLFMNTLSEGYFEVPYLWILLVGLYFMIFLHKQPTTKKEALYEIAYTTACSYLILITFALSHVQWAIFPSIFLIFTLAMSDKRYLKRNLVIEMLFEIGLFWQQVSRYGHNYLVEYEFDRLVFKNINHHFIPSLNWVKFARITTVADNKITVIFAAIALVATIAILLLNCPWRKKQNDKVSINFAENEKFMKRMVSFRTFIVAGYVLTCIVIRFVL